MHILITGGAGYLGSVLAGRLLSSGHQVRILDSLMHGGESLLGLFPHQRFSFIKGDIRTKSTVSEALSEGIDAVVHLAAIVGDPACSKSPDLAREVNLNASLQLLDLCHQRNISRFVFASTCSNYGKMADNTKPLDETSELNPVSLYARTKVSFEKILLGKDFTQRPITTVLRISTLFGLSPRMRFDLTVNEFTRDLLLNRHLVVYGEQFYRPYVHITDAARAIEIVLNSDSKTVNRQVFNVGTSDANYRKGELVEMISQQMEHDVTIERVRKDEDPRDYRVCFDKIRDQLNFTVTRRVNYGISEVKAALQNKVICDTFNPRFRN